MEIDICTQYAASYTTVINIVKKFRGDEDGSTLVVNTIVSKVFVNTEPEIYFSLEGQVVPLALWAGPSSKSFGVFFEKSFD